MSREGNTSGKVPSGRARMSGPMAIVGRNAEIKLGRAARRRSEKLSRALTKSITLSEKAKR